MPDQAKSLLDIERLRVDGERLWDSLMQMAEIGATEKGGCNRQALTDLDKQGRDLFVSWCLEIGCSVTVDQMGNIFARRSGAAYSFGRRDRNRRSA